MFSNRRVTISNQSWNILTQKLDTAQPDLVLQRAYAIFVLLYKHKTGRTWRAEDAAVSFNCDTANMLVYDKG